MRIKEQKDINACKKEKSAVAKHAWTSQHLILWDKTTVIDQGRRQTDCFLKELSNAHLSDTEDQCFNWDTAE